MLHAVLTGDFVDSSDLAPDVLDAAMAELRDGCAAISDWRDAGGRPVQARFARRGGDGWQVALDSPHHWMRAALYLRARLRRAELGLTRIAIATGEGTLPRDGDPNSAHGPAFTSSGRLLEALPSSLLMSHAAGGTAAAAAVLADHVSQGWTRTQARTLCALLAPAPPTHAELAERLGISRQAVDQSARAAALPALSEAIDRIEGDET